MQILRLSLQNFQSVKNLELTLDPDKKYLLSGANGAGKSSIIGGIFFVLTGKDVDGKAYSDFISLGENYVYGEVLISHLQKKMLVTRKRTIAGSQECTVIIDDENGESKLYNDTPTKLSSVIFNFLFPSRNAIKTKDLTEMLIRTVFLSGERLDIFSSIEISPTEKMNIIYNLIDNDSMHALETLEQILKDKAKEITAKLSVIKELIMPESEVGNHKHHIEVLLEKDKEYLEKITTLEEERKEFIVKKSKITTALNEIQEKRKTIESRKRDAERSLRELEGEILAANHKNDVIRRTRADYTKQIEKLTTELIPFQVSNKYDSSLDYPLLIEETVKKKQELFGEEKRLSEERKHTFIENAKTANCPECSSTIIYNTGGLYKKDDVEKLELLRQNIDRLLLKNKVEIEEINNKYISLKEEQKNYQKFMELSKERDELIKRKEDFTDEVSEPIELLALKERKLQQIAQYDIELEPYDISSFVKELEEADKISSRYGDDILELKDKIRENNSTREQKKERIAQHEKNFAYYISGEKALSATDRWMKLIKIYRQERVTQTLVDFEYYSNQIFGELYEGELKFEFENLGSTTGKFKIFGKLESDEEFRPINTFSSGERRRCGFAMCLAAREIITPNEGLSLLVLDECLDKIDDFGRVRIAENLIESDNQVLLITHTADVANYFQDVIHVTNQNGESFVELR